LTVRYRSLWYGGGSSLRPGTCDLQWLRRWMCPFVVVFCVMASVASGRADEVKLTPSITVKEEYNDNILYAPSETYKDFFTMISAGLSFLQKTERLKVDLSGRADRRIYSRYSEFNATDQFYSGTGSYSMTERLGLTGKAGYSVDSRPDRDLEVTGLSFTGVERYRQTYGFGANYLLSEILLATFTYDYLNDKYDDARYSDMEAHIFNLGAVHDLNYFMQKTQARTNIVYSRYNIQNSRIDNYEWTVGLNRALDEKWNLLADGGLRYTTSRFTFTEAIRTPPFLLYRYEDNKEWGGAGQLALTYKSEKNSGEVKINHDIMPASGRSGTTERTAFLANITMRLTYDLQWGVSGGYFINKSRAGQYSVQRIDEESLWISPNVIYNHSRDVSIGLSYIHNRSHSYVAGTDTERNVFQIRYRMQHDLFQ